MEKTFVVSTVLSFPAIFLAPLSFNTPSCASAVPRTVCLSVHLSRYGIDHAVFTQW